MPLFAPTRPLLRHGGSRVALRRCRGFGLILRERLLPGVQFPFALRQLLFLLRLMFGVETALDLPIDIGLTFRVSLLLLTRTKD